MKALTLHRPWSDAIVHGPKRVENRTWRPPVRVLAQRIAIHAGKAYAVTVDLPGGYVAPSKEDCPTGIVGVATVAGYLDARKGRRDRVQRWPFSNDGARIVNALSSLDSDPYWIGPVGWLLECVVALPEPIPMNGKQGLWNVPPSVVECIDSMLARVST